MDYVYYESINRDLKIRLIYECRCDERLKTQSEESTRLTYTGLVEELEHLKIKTRLIDEKFVSVMGECDLDVMDTPSKVSVIRKGVTLQQLLKASIFHFDPAVVTLIRSRLQSESDLQDNFDPLEISERHRSTGILM